MSKKYLKPVICSFSALLVLAGALYGCNFRESLPEKKVAGKLRSDPLSEVELRKFASVVRPIDGDAEAHYQLALHFQENNRHKLAIDELRLVLQRNPAHVKAYNALGVSYDNLGDHEAAIESYQIALKIDPKLDYVSNNLGYSYLLNGQTVEAVAVFQQAIAISPKEKRFRNNLALAYVKQGSYDQAYEQFRAVDSVAGAETIFAKVMRDLGMGAQAEKVLLAARSAAVTLAKAEMEPAEKLPDLAEQPEPMPANDPIARYQAVTGSMGPAPRGEVPKSSASQTPTPTSESSTLSEVQNKGQELVVHIPPPIASQENLYELKLTTALPEPPMPVALSKRATYYPIASVALAGSSAETPKTKAAVPSHSVVPVQKELREIEQPAQVKVESREQQEERILVAASSARAAGWQNAPEPRMTAEKGLVEVEVANGNGVKGSAGKVAAHLRKYGFNVVRVMDAQSHDHFSTKVFYYGNIAEARRVLESLPDVADQAELYELEGMGSRIRLLVGKDMSYRDRISSNPR